MNNEQPTGLERATKQEETKEEERAIADEEPTARERARYQENPKDLEREEEAASAFIRKPLLYQFALHFQTVQRLRVGIEASLRTRGVEDKRATIIAQQLEALECQVVKIVEEEAEEKSIWPWILQQKGVGPRIGGMLVALIDIQRCPSISSLWRYAGLAVIEGKAERRTAGAKLHFNMRLKKTCFLLARSFVMAKNETYEPIYREAKEWYTANRPEWTKLHCDLAARRKMVKIFLAHLWIEWRTAEGLPVSGPYVQDIMNHAHIV